MERRTTDTTPFYVFESLAAIPLPHAVLTRHGGVSEGPYQSLNLSFVVGDDEAAVRENIRRAYTVIGGDPTQGVRPWMVHGSRTRAVDRRHAGQRVPPADGLVTATPGLPLTMTFGDCQPILIYDPIHHALALGHAGWRGTLAGIALSLVAALQANFGSRPQTLRAALGPAIGACCYEVGPDVVARASWPGSRHWFQPNSHRPHFDLTAANTDLLLRTGIPASNIEQANLCTGCRTDEFFSYRKEKPVTGRFALLAMLA
ncbi:MAG: peptidoglycan editing factor PgeF [Ardenticatenaceae bacterium]|nr:peptidoglycan editing factor PgeF [Ardenticatenaceae bacterium]